MRRTGRSLLPSTCPLALCAAWCAALTACDPPAALHIDLPDGLPLAELAPAQRALLRATLAVAGGALAETELALDIDERTLSGDFALQNVTASDQRALTLRMYGRAAPDASEVLLGHIVTTLALAPASETRITFAGQQFDTCAAASDGRCTFAFDVNRNGVANVLDLISGIDPAPQAPFLDLSPSTLQFPSGIRAGAFARQVIVLENRGPHPMQVVRAEVVGGQGLGLSVFDASGLVSQAPRRALDVAQLADNAGVIAPNGEVFLAVSFAPVHLFLTTAAVQVVVEDIVTHVQQTARTEVIANAEGTLRPPPPAYDAPAPVVLQLEVGSLQATPFPPAELFSGLALTSTARSSGAQLLVELIDEDTEGAPLLMPADVAFLINIPARHRLSTRLDVTADVDLAVFTLAGAALGAPACPLCVSSHAGNSPESADFSNDSDVALPVVVVLGRVQLADAAFQFALTAQVSRGPEFADVAPVSPSEGALEGGAVVTLRGRGFQGNATVTFAEKAALDVSISDDADGLSTVSLTLPPGSLDVGKNPATIVVQNPSLEDGGDGQAATLPLGFTYQPPAPSLTAVAPSLASTSGGGLPVILDGAFFSTRFGPPVVSFGELLVEATFISSLRIVVTPPALPLAEQGTARTVALTVANRLPEDAEAPDVRRLGASSNTRDFSFLVPNGAAPTITSVGPGAGSVEGGEAMNIVGSGFRERSAVFIGGRQATLLVSNLDGTQLIASTPARDEAGTVDVVVLNEDGQSATLAGGYGYTIPAPAVTDVFPQLLVIDGGTLLVVTGTGFREGVTAAFVGPGVERAAVTVTRVSRTTLLVLTPPFPVAGAWSIRVQNADGQQASGDLEVFQPVGVPPSLVGIEPSAGGAGGGYLVTVIGTGFVTPTVLFGSAIIQGDALTFDSSGGLNRVSFTAPPSAAGLAGAVGVQVVNADGQSDGVSFNYELAAAAGPRVDRVEPAMVPVASFTSLRVFGANLADVVEVLAGGLPIPFVLSSSFAIKASLLPLVEGPLVISVVTAAGDIVSFPITVAAAPLIDGLSTSVVHAGVAGDQLLIFGDGLDVGDLIVEVTLGSGELVGAASMLLASPGFLLVELPRLPVSDDLRLTVRAIVVAGGEDRFTNIVGASAGPAGALSESPPFAARAPLTRGSFFSAIAPDGLVTFNMFGEQLNAARLTSILLTDASNAARNVPCVVQRAGENLLQCRSSIAAFPEQSYGIALQYTEVFAGSSAPVDVVGADAAGLPQLAQVPDVGQLTLCGDRFVREDEQCDDGNNIDNDDCSNACLLPGCGDGVFQVGEACDDGNTIDDDACSNSCRVPTTSLSIDPIARDFGQVSLGFAGQGHVFTVTNTGAASIGPITVLLSGLSPGQFVIEDNSCLVSLLSQESCVVFVVFQPTSLGGHSAVLEANGAAAGTVSAVLTGTGVAIEPPILQVSPTVAEFQSVTVGQASAPRTFTVAFSGGTLGALVSLTFEGNDAGEFNLNDDDCAALPASQLCTFNVAFAPTSLGQKSVVIQVSSAGANPVLVALTGTGVAIEPPILQVSPTSADFAGVPVGTTSAPKTFNVAFSGKTGTPVSLTFDGNDAGEFDLDVGDCASLSQSLSCTFEVVFKPLSNGPKSVVLHVSSEGADPVSVALNGLGVAVETPTLQVSPTSADFAEVPVGTTSAPITFTVDLGGGTPGTPISLTFVDNDAGEFDLDVGDCASLSQSLSCTFNVAFTPPSLGQKSVTLQVSSAGANPVLVELNGLGVGVDVPTLQVSPNVGDFPSVTVGQASAPITFTVDLGGGTPGTPVSLTFVDNDAGEFDLDVGDCASLSQSLSCTFEVVFKPLSNGPKSVVLQVSSEGANPVSVELNGLGVGVDVPTLQVSPTSADFAEVPVGTTSAPITFTVAFSGSTPGTPVSLTFVDNNAGEFVLFGLSDCGGVPVSQLCTFNVAFTPTSLGPKSVVLHVSSEGADPVSVPLTGFGVQSPPPFAATSCLDHLLNILPTVAADGIYRIDPDTEQGPIAPFDVYCDMHTDGGGYTFLKQTANDAGFSFTIPDQEAEQHCAARGMRLIVPRTAAHFQSAILIALDGSIGFDGGDAYVRMLGIYPSVFPATCKKEPLRSPNCVDWGVLDTIGSYFISDTPFKDASGVEQPSGDGCPLCSMTYSYNTDGILAGFDDQPFPATSTRFICHIDDK